MPYMSGYADWATFIVEDKDRSATIYRRFDELAARSLLRMQSELLFLESKQQDMDKADRLMPISVKACTRDWGKFISWAEDENSPHTNFADERLKLELQIRAKVKEYREPSSDQSSRS